MAEHVVLSLGSNMGDRVAHLQRGLDDLAAHGLVVVAVSSVYETEPVGGPDQGPYLNAVVLACTELSPEGVLRAAHRAESAEGRVRHLRWGPRTLDVDIVTFGEVRRNDETLTLPHPRAHERAFVLVPWAEVDAQARVPGRGSVVDLAADVAGQEVRRRDDLALRVGDVR